MIQKYLGRPHKYGEWDCILIATEFYKHEFGIDIKLPPYSHSDLWMKEYTLEYADEFFSQYGKKVPLTEARNYALMIFKSNRRNLICHFGVFLAPISILHVEEGRLSCIDTLCDDLRQKLHAVYNIV